MNLKELFFKKQIKQLQVAKETGIDPALLSKVVNGWVRLPEKYCIKLAENLGITPEEIKANKINPQRGGK